MTTLPMSPDEVNPDPAPQGIVRLATGASQQLPPAERLRLFKEEIEYQRAALALLNKNVTDVLERGPDYDTIPGTKKPALLQPGAQKVCQALGILPTYSVREVDDPNRQTSFEIKVWEGYGKNRAKVTVTGNARGYYAATVTCTLTGRNLFGLAQGIGTCSNLETKYVRQRCDDVRHTVLMIAAKRAYVAATRTVACLSDRFTQDTEDMPPEVLEDGNGGGGADPLPSAGNAEAVPAPTPTRTPAPPSPSQQPLPTGTAPPRKPNGPTISEAQGKRLWALAFEGAKMRKMDREAAHTKINGLLKAFGYEDVDDIARSDYDTIVGRVMAWGDGK